MFLEHASPFYSFLSLSVVDFLCVKRDPLGIPPGKALKKYFFGICLSSSNLGPEDNIICVCYTKYRVRQRGCSLTHSARTPPAFKRN